MKGDVKVLVSGSSGHIVFDEKSLIKRILMYVISAILGFGALFLAIMMDSRAYAATLPEIFMGTFEDAYTGGDPDEIAQMPETGDVITTPRTVVILGSKWKLKVTAKVTLTGKALAVNQFNFRLYKDSVNESNLIKASKNAADGSIDFGAIKIRDITKSMKLIAVQEDEEGYNNKTGNLNATKTIILKADGTLSITGE